MAGKKLQYAFRLVHIDNIPHILEYGLVRSGSPNVNPNYVPIGDQLVIEKRRNRLLESSSWKKIGDFIPFYFGPRSPMLYVIQHGYNNEVFAYRWDDDENLDLKRRKEAELLLKNDLPLQYIKGFVVYNLETKQLLLSMGVDETKVVVKPNYYF